MTTQVQPIQHFPTDGRVRARQAASYLSIGLSTYWLYVRQRRIKKPTKYGSQISTWDAVYIRQLAEDGIPKASAGEDAP